MILKRAKVFLIAFSVMFMFGCREYHLYKYDPVTLDVLGGELVIALEGTYGQNYTEEGKRLADYGAPYSLQFMLAMPYEFDLSGIEIKNIQAVGERSKTRISLPEVSSSKVKDPRKRTDPNAKARTVIASIGGLTTEKLSYETYLLTAIVVVYEDKGKTREESISVRLETSYKKDRRSDWFDKNMSI